MDDATLEKQYLYETKFKQTKYQEQKPNYLIQVTKFDCIAFSTQVTKGPKRYVFHSTAWINWLSEQINKLFIQEMGRVHYEGKNHGITTVT